MAGFKKILLGIPGVIWAGLLALSTVAPKDAKANLAKWAAEIGLNKWPHWLTDTRAILFAGVAVAGFYVWWWSRKRRSGSAVRLEIRRVDIMGDDKTDAAQVAPIVFAKNDGVPTTLRDWTLDVRLQGGQVTIRGDYLPLSLAEDVAYTNLILRRGDGLDAKTSNSPIIHGGAEIGRLLFSVRGASKAQVAQHDTSFVLSATDITGKQATTTQSVSVLATFGRSEGSREQSETDA